MISACLLACKTSIWSILHMHFNILKQWRWPHAPLLKRAAVSLTFPIFVSVLEGLNQSKSFIHWATHWQVINSDLPQNAFVVNHKQTSDKEKDIIYGYRHNVPEKYNKRSNNNLWNWLQINRSNYFKLTQKCGYCTMHTLQYKCIFSSTLLLPSTAAIVNCKQKYSYDTNL